MPKAKKGAWNFLFGQMPSFSQISSLMALGRVPRQIEKRIKKETNEREEFEYLIDENIRLIEEGCNPERVARNIKRLEELNRLL
jgi:hypothetical protein